MFKRVTAKLLNIYKNVLDVEISESNFLKGNLIQKFNIDSLIALQLIADIEKDFNLIIEEDELAIKIVDSPFEFSNYYLCNKLKMIYESVLKIQLEESEIAKESLLEKLYIDNQSVSKIIAEIKKCFPVMIDNTKDVADIVNCPLTFLNNCQEVSKK